MQEGNLYIYEICSCRFDIGKILLIINYGLRNG
jgi:hypothetical protein